MTRPKMCLCKNIAFEPNAVYFKPSGVRIRNLEIITLSLEEIEAYRLRHIEEMDQRFAGEAMGVSTSTYQRILDSAYKKIAEALVYGKAIKIIKHEEI